MEALRALVADEAERLRTKPTFASEWAVLDGSGPKPASGVPTLGRGDHHHRRQRHPVGLVVHLAAVRRQPQANATLVPTAEEHFSRKRVPSDAVSIAPDDVL